MPDDRTVSKRLGEPTLTAADWAEAALQLVAESGLKSLTVDRLALRLKVTKGSFYWHFKGRDELLQAALLRWEENATMATMRGLESVPDARRRVELIMEATSQPPRSRSLYAALAQGAENSFVREVLDRVASSRIDFLQKCYQEMGKNPQEAKALAVLAYSSYRGLLQLAHEAPASLPREWSVYAQLIRSTFIPA